MITDTEYREWRLDPTRNNSRVVLVELDYASGYEVVGHGRYNSEANLNEVINLSAQSYANGQVDIRWRQPTSQEGYEGYEVWVNGKHQETVTGGSYVFNKATYEGQGTIVIDVCSRKEGGKQYSKPWRVPVPVNQPWAVQFRFGSLNSWGSVGPGPGVELTGTARIASRDYLSENNEPYDEYLSGDFVLEESLTDFLSVGDISAINPESYKGQNWRDLRWRGYPVRVYHGDTTWPKRDFRQIATAMNEACRVTGPKQYVFDTIDLARHLNRTFVTDDHRFNSNVKDAISYIASNGGLNLVGFFNIPAERNFTVDYTVTESTKALEAIKKIADSAGAFVRVTQSGGVDVFVPNNKVNPSTKLTITQGGATEVLSIVEAESVAIHELDSDSIAYGSVKMVRNTPSYSKVVIKMSNGAKVQAPTGAFTGDLAETFTVESVLSNVGQATALLNELKEYYAVNHAVWELGIIDMADLLQVGDRVNINDELVTGYGTVEYIRRTPLSPVSIIEVSI